MQKLGFTLTVCYLITNVWFTHLMHQIGISADDKRKKARKAKARTNKSCQIAGKYHLLPRRNPQFAKVWNDFSLLQFCSFGNAEKWKKVFGLHLIISQLKGCMRTTTNKILKLVDGSILHYNCMKWSYQNFIRIASYKVPKKCLIFSKACFFIPLRQLVWRSSLKARCVNEIVPKHFLLSSSFWCTY